MLKIAKALAFAGVAVIVLAGPAFASHTLVTAVPEPTSILLLAGGIGAIAGLRYYRLRK
jgi:hypothetical protein